MALCTYFLYRNFFLLMASCPAKFVSAVFIIQPFYFAGGNEFAPLIACVTVSTVVRFLMQRVVKDYPFLRVTQKSVTPRLFQVNSGWGFNSRGSYRSYKCQNYTSQ